MKNIRLINPLQAQDVFKTNNWTDVNAFYIQTETGGVKSILANAELPHELIYGDVLKIKVNIQSQWNLVFRFLSF